MTEHTLIDVPGLGRLSVAATTAQLEALPTGRFEILGAAPTDPNDQALPLHTDDHGAWNIGEGNSGHGNIGNWNSGSRNTGHHNIGHGNTGNVNVGYNNNGNHNKGNHNVGDNNNGSHNLGNQNCGYSNSGDGINGFQKTDLHK